MYKCLNKILQGMHQVDNCGLMNTTTRYEFQHVKYFKINVIALLNIAGKVMCALKSSTICCLAMKPRWSIPHVKSAVSWSITVVKEESGHLWKAITLMQLKLKFLLTYCIKLSNTSCQFDSDPSCKIWDICKIANAQIPSADVNCTQIQQSNMADTNVRVTIYRKYESDASWKLNLPQTPHINRHKWRGNGRNLERLLSSDPRGKFGWNKGFRFLE